MTTTPTSCDGGGGHDDKDTPPTWYTEKPRYLIMHQGCTVTITHDTVRITVAVNATVMDGEHHYIV